MTEQVRSPGKTLNRISKAIILAYKDNNGYTEQEERILFIG